MKKHKKKTKSKNKVKKKNKLSLKDILITIINVIVVISLGIAKLTLNPAISIAFAFPFIFICIYVVLFEETSKLKVSKFIPEKLRDVLGMYGFLIMFAYIIDLYHAHYASYGRLLLFICCLLLSAFINIKHSKIPLSNALSSGSHIIFKIIFLSICITPILSGINTAFPIKTTETVSAKIINTKITYKPKNGRNYYVYVDKNSAPSINNKFLCDASYYRKQRIGSYASISYKRGLLGLKYAELIE